MIQINLIQLHFIIRFCIQNNVQNIELFGSNRCNRG